MFQLFNCLRKGTHDDESGFTGWPYLLCICHWILGEVEFGIIFLIHYPVLSLFNLMVVMVHPGSTQRDV